MSSEHRRTIVEHASDEHREQQAQTAEELIKEWLSACSKALTRGRPEDYRAVSVKMGNTIVPKLREYGSLELLNYDRRLGGSENWHWGALSEFLEDADLFVSHFHRVATSPVDGTSAQSAGLIDSNRRARLVVEDALESLAAIAENEGIIMDDYAARVDGMGLGLKIGEHLQDEKRDFGDPLHVMAFGKGTLKILHGGETGDGKSTGMEREAEAFYHYDPDDEPAGLDSAPKTPFKLLHMADLDTGEAWVKDLPQMQEDLRDVREEQQLEPDFAAAEHLSEPTIQILLPLTDELDGTELPYDTGTEEIVPEPFVIPACEIPRGLMLAAIMARVTNEGERAVRSAYDEVERERDNWALTHLADKIREREELSDKQKANAVSVLRSLQDEGFIRTKEDERTLDWREIFTTTDVYTVFTQPEVLCKSEFGQQFCIAYLIDRLLRLRGGRMYDIPQALTMFPELWRIVPHNQRNNPDDRIAAVQKFTAQRLSEALRLNRRYGIHVIGDTQYPYDLINSVREGFNRYSIYSGSYQLSKGAFNWTGNDKHSSFHKRLTSKEGQAGIVGEVQPAIRKSWVEYISPFAYAPPSHHHFDAEVDQTGWRARVKYLSPAEECPECGCTDLVRSDDRRTVTCQAEDCGEETLDLSLGREEVLEPHGWDTSVPERLQIAPYDKDADDDEDDDGEEFDQKAAWRQEARRRNARGQSIREIREALPPNPDTGNKFSTSTIGGWCDDIDKGEGLPDDA